MTHNLLNSGFSEVRLRFAPSPTGWLHVGGARTALFNYLFAKAHSGTFILRIEDTDQVRSSEEATKQVLSSLQWLGIDWDEGPDPDFTPGEEHKNDRGTYGSYFQAKRLPLYRQFIEQLVKEDKAYPCFCSDEELEKKRQRQMALGIPYTYDRACATLSKEEVEARKDTYRQADKQWIYRFRVVDEEVIFEDQVKGMIKFDTKLISDFVVQKADGYPTYNFAVVVDDSNMKISHVLRGDDHISNTPRQILIYRALRKPIPQYYHISMILGNTGEKLSKRHGAVSVLEFKELGYYPDPFINHLALLGWSPEDGVEIINREKLAQAFIHPKFSSSPAIFDEAKLHYLNGHYIRNLSEKIILTDFKKILQTNKLATDSLHYNYILNGLKHPKVDEILLLLRNHCKKLTDIVDEFTEFVLPTIDEKINHLKKTNEENKDWLESEESQKLFSLAVTIFSDSKTDSKEFISSEEFKTLLSEAKKELGIKGKNFFMPLRLKLTGATHGVELDQFLNLKYRKEVIARLKSS